jgi:DNA-binding MarR family transcriptional regulator
LRQGDEPGRHGGPPPSTRVIASLAELGFVARDAHPADGRQVLVSVWAGTRA